MEGEDVEGEDEEEQHLLCNKKFNVVYLFFYRHAYFYCNFS